MLIRMTTGLSGPAYSLGPGDERDFPQDEALRFIAAGYAVPVAGQEIERAVEDPPAIETRPAVTAPTPTSAPRPKLKKKKRR